MDSPKEILDSKYILLYKIGSGGTAEVYLSQDIKNNNISATKIQNKEEEEGKEKKGNIFKAESEILNSIKNENIVNIIDYGEGSIENEKGEKGEKYPYLTLEYAEKGDLFNYIYFPKRGFNEELGKIIFKEILNGVKACHDNKIVHRDLKLENILLTDEFKVKIADFGFAIKIKDNEKLKTILGTPTYQAPEILLKKPYDGIKVDIFSLGVILFILVTGIKPFENPFGKDKLYKFILKKQFAEYWKLIKNYNVDVDNLSNDFKQLFIKMILFNPSDRPSLDEIINSNWMKSDLSQSNEVLEEFKIRENLVTKNLKSTYGISSSSSNKNRLRSKKKQKMNINLNKIKKYFNENINVPNAEKNKGYNQIYTINNKNLSPFDFMNCLCHLILERIDSVEEIIPNKNYLRFNVVFKEIKEEEVKEDENNEEEIEGMNIEVVREKCNIQVNFYEDKIENKNIIVFRKINGDKFEFYDNVQKIKDLISNILDSKLDFEYV